MTPTVLFLLIEMSFVLYFRNSVTKFSLSIFYLHTSCKWDWTQVMTTLVKSFPYSSFGRKTRLTDLKKFGLTDLRTNEPSD